MYREQTKQTLKLRLLAFVLAVALVWYSFNPSRRPVHCNKKEDPDEEKKRNVQPQKMAAAALPVMFRPSETIVEILETSDEDLDDFDWPEFIDG